MALRDFALLVVICLLWASNNIVSKYVVAYLHAPPLFYAAVRFAIVAIAVFPWLRPVPKPFWRLILVALCMGAGSFAFVFLALKTASPSSVAIVSQLMVPMTTVLSFLILRERLSRRRLTGIALTLLGALAVMWDPHGFKISEGLLFVVASAFLGSLGAVLMKGMEGVKPLQFQAWVGLASSIPLALASAGLETGQVDRALAAGWPFLAALAYTAIAVSLLGHSLFFNSLLRASNRVADPDFAGGHFWRSTGNSQRHWRLSRVTFVTIATTALAADAQMTWRTTGATRHTAFGAGPCRA